MDDDFMLGFMDAAAAAVPASLAKRVVFTDLAIVCGPDVALTKAACSQLLVAEMRPTSLDNTNNVEFVLSKEWADADGVRSRDT